MKKLLIVDDSVELLEAMQFFLEKQGFQVRILTNTNIVFDVVKNYQPDLIILDVFIAGKDGREICRSLRINCLTKYLCIMLFSASPAAIKDYEFHGADGCIEKPFSLSNILEKINSVIEKCKDYNFN